MRPKDVFHKRGSLICILLHLCKLAVMALKTCGKQQKNFSSKGRLRVCSDPFFYSRKKKFIIMPAIIKELF